MKKKRCRFNGGHKKKQETTEKRANCVYLRASTQLWNDANVLNINIP